MSRTRCHLTKHAKDDSIPLRLGRFLENEKIYLENIEEDDEGTKGQRPNEIERGNWHAIADFWLDEVSGEHLGRWRFVLGSPDQDWKDPPVVTVLPVERSTIKSEGTLTLLLQRERQSGKHQWLTPNYVATTLHQLYRNGELSRVEELSELIRDRDKAPLIQANLEAERLRKEESLAREIAERERDQARDEKELATQNKAEADRQRLKALHAKDAAEEQWEEEYQAREEAERERDLARTENRTAIQARDAAERDKQDVIKRLAEVTDERDQLAQALARADELSKSEEGLSTLSEAAKRVTRRWPSKTGSDYMNVGIEATIKDVRQIGTKIFLTYLDQFGNPKTVNDFGLKNGFVQLVYDYLRSCRDEKRRAVFILTYKPDGVMMLASDTMLLANYVSLWRK